MARHLADSVWKYDCDQIATMLSPRDTKKKALIDRPVVKRALKKTKLPSPPTLKLTPEKVNYEPLAKFLNEAEEISHSIYTRVFEALGLNKPEERYYPRLFFRTYDRKTVDCVNGAGPLLPDLTGHITEPSPNFSACWSLGRDTSASADEVKVHQIQLAVEVKSDWRLLLLQIATYARACLSAAPHRRFVVCIGFNQLKEEFKVFVFHSGGVAASTALSLESISGRRSFVQFLLTLGLWQNAEDAGYLKFTNGHTYALPSYKLTTPPETTNFVLDRILHHRLDLCGRRTFVVLARKATEYVILIYALHAARANPLRNSATNEVENLVAPQHGLSSIRTRLGGPSNIPATVAISTQRG